MRCLEFYSGLGGMHYALAQSLPQAEVVCAFDINTIANDVYEHSHGMRPYQGNIEKLSVKQLEAYKADMWLLAPPCQPYTRRGLQKDADDWRATSFMTLLLKLPQMQAPPMRLLVENVVGFEGSRTRARMVEVMQAAGYAIQEFLISPVQLGIPYSRPRYFALMQRTPDKGGSPFPLQADPNGSPFIHPPFLLMQQQQPASDGKTAVHSTAVTVQPVHNFLEDRHAFHTHGQAVCDTVHSTAGPSHCDRAKSEEEKASSCGQHSSSSAPPHGADTNATALDHMADDDEEDDEEIGKTDRGLLVNGCFAPLNDVPADVIAKWGHVLDIVTPHSTVTNCFTKTYSRFAKGCGSVLATQNLESIGFEYSTQQRSSSSQPFIKPRLIARPAHSLLPNMPHAETPQQTCHEREQGVQSDGGLQRPNSHLDEHPCGQQRHMVNFTDTKFYSFWISSVTKVRDAFGKRRSKKAAEGILDEFVATDQLTLPVLQLFRRQSVYNFVVSDLPDLRENWLAELTAAPLHRVHLTRCSQVSDASMLALRHQKCLTDLDLHDCIKLTDEGVACLQGLTALTILNMHGCEVITSRGIQSICALTNLQHLNLALCNRAAGLQHIAGLAQLEHLNLGWCTSITDEDMKGLQHLTTLSNLQLSRTKVSDKGLLYLQGLHQLKRLGLQGTAVTGTGMPVVGALSGLQALALAQTSVDSQGLLHLTGLQQLTQLDLAYTNITDSCVHSLQHLTTLLDLNLDSCNITDRGCSALFSAVTGIQKLDLSDTVVRDDGMQAVAQLSNLNNLNLAYSGVGDAGLQELSALTSLTALNLDSRLFTDVGMRHLKPLTNLVLLDLFAAKVSDIGCGYIRHLQKLESLEICGGRVTDLGAAVLSTVPSLTSLSLAHNLAITDTALPLLARLTNLCSLNLTHSKISGNGLTALYGLTELTSFSAYSTRVRRSAAEKLQAALPNLQKLRLGQGAAPPPTHVA
ncbi:hypothetical protein WJX82_009131 [Trebouxia sp. C0006]